MHRIRNHKSPFLPDKNHIHHKLLALGIKPRQAMLGSISFSLLLSVANILLSRYVGITVLFTHVPNHPYARHFRDLI